MAVWALTGLLAVHVYSPASLRLAGLMMREPPEMVILESAVTVEPPLPHWTVISVPAVHVQLRDTFPPSNGTKGTDKLTPATASMGRKINFTKAEMLRKDFKINDYYRYEPECLREKENERELTSKVGVTEQ